MHASMFNYARRRWMWIALALTAAAIAAYALDSPRSPPSGDTWLGYTLGGVGAALILWLSFLGVRKRRYASTLGSVQGWVSAHVWLGLALLVVVTLHAGFQFGANIHTVAYVLMCVVVSSGVVGTIVYARLPAELSRNRAALTREQMLLEIADLDARATRIAAQLPAEYGDAVRSNRDRLRIGGSAWVILGARDRSQVRLPGPSGAMQLVANPQQGPLLEWLGLQLSRSTEGERTRAIQELITMIGARRVVLRRLTRDAQVKGWLEAWLYVHVPVTFALLGALIAHVVSVFYYW
jgi:hypothetical protein